MGLKIEFERVKINEFSSKRNIIVLLSLKDNQICHLSQNYEPILTKLSKKSENYNN